MCPTSAERDDGDAPSDPQGPPDPTAEPEIDALLEEHLPGLRAFVRLRSDRMLRSKESNSDLVQSVCREVLEHVDRFQHRGEGSFRQWLYRTAERKIIDRFRYYTAEKRHAARETERIEGGDDEERLLAAYRTIFTPSRDAAAREEMRRFEDTFLTLPEASRQVITLARIAGLSHAQIVEETGLSMAQVRNALYRGLAELSDKLAKGRR